MAAARIMSSLTPTTTKKPKRKKKPTPKYVGRLPPSKPYHMSDTQWEALQAMHLQFEDYRRELYTEKHSGSARGFRSVAITDGSQSKRSEPPVMHGFGQGSSDAWLWSGESGL